MSRFNYRMNFEGLVKNTYPINVVRPYDSGRDTRIILPNRPDSSFCASVVSSLPTETGFAMIRCSSSTATTIQTCSLLIPRLYVLVLSLNSCKYPGIAVTCSHRPCFFKYSSCSVIVMLCLGNLLSFQMKNSGFLLPLNETGQYHSSHCAFKSLLNIVFMPPKTSLLM